MLNGNKKLIKDQRKTIIARILVQKPGITQRQIHAMLSGEGQSGKRKDKVVKYVNPETGKPFSLGTINSDIKEIRAEWAAERLMPLPRRGSSRFRCVGDP